MSNQPWLDFVNTQVKQHGEWVDLLSDFTDLVRWLGEAGALDDAGAREALRRWPDPSERTGILERARAFRATLRAAAEGVARAEPVTEETVAVLNDILRHHCRHLQLVFAGDRLTRHDVGEITESVHLLAPMAVSAAEALSGDDLTLTRKCENPACVLLFHDTTKNHTRRWCRMETCGNRHKAAAHYQRVRRRDGV